MRLPVTVLSCLLLSAAAACTEPIDDCCLFPPSLRVVNAFSTSVDVLIDGNVALSSLGAGAIGSAMPAAGPHTIVLRPTGSSTSVSQSITTVTGATNTVAAVRATSGAVSSVVLDDTNSVVAAGKTKMRVIHFAPNAGTIQVYRTQPDWGTPTNWQFPFTYQPEPNALSAPFLESTVGSWEIRVWLTPADESGWATAPIKLTIPVGSGQKKTVIILDKPGGGLTAQVL